MNNYLLSGSIAYDTILVHEGHFHARILPESVSRLNVSFGIDSAKEEFGGTAGNIAYNAALLQDIKPVLCSSVGHDFKPYKKHFEKHGIDVSTLTIAENERTAHAWIMTDVNNNQISGFNKGALNVRPTLPQTTPDLWHIAPDDARTMAYLAKTACEKQQKYFFDPGQCLPGLVEGASESVWPLKEIISNATGLFVNEYEGELLEKGLGKNLTDLAGPNTQFIIKTLGGKGVTIFEQQSDGSYSEQHVGVAKTDRIVDPTGCGDAFRSGFINAYLKGKSLKECAQLGSVVASFAIEESGGQNHSPSLQMIYDRLQLSFPEQNVKKPKF